MRWIKYVILGLGITWVLITGCNQRIVQSALQSNQITYDSLPGEMPDLCNQPASYIPDTQYLDHTPIKYIRVNFHFMNDRRGRRNFDEVAAYAYAENLLRETEHHLTHNQQMWLPPGNKTPALPTRYRYILTASAGFEKEKGVYCHYDDQLFYFVSRGKNRNNYNRSVIQQYGIGLDSILNIFVMPHHPDSVASETYHVTSAGIALGGAIKISGIYETGKKAWEFKGLINHEIGHVMGLRHTWSGNDGCDDTPTHPNCWNRSKDPPCNTMASNNLMDYNANQHAWTPCQIGKIHQRMARERSLIRKLLLPTWCKLDTTKTIHIHDEVLWQGAKDLEGNIIIHPGGSLEIQCRVSIPKSGKVLVKSGGKLILNGARIHNACGDRWTGIEVQTRQKIAGSVIFKNKPVLENMIHPLEPMTRTEYTSDQQ